MDADLVILGVPVGVMGPVAAEIAADLPADAIISDVGSCKAGILAALQEALPGRTIIPAHPVAGTENSGPEAGFASLFKGRSEEHTSELQSLMRISYAVFCLKTKQTIHNSI